MAANTHLLPIKKLTIADVQGLGRVLIDVANLYPTRFVTEREFFPSVLTYLTARIPSVDTEVSSAEGKIDLQLRGNNPTWLELAVQPRIIIDTDCPEVRFPGHESRNSLYASQNRAELRKLMREPRGGTRFLLLIDFTGNYDSETLRRGYCAEVKRIGHGKPVRVVLSSQDSSRDDNFLARA